MIVPIKKARLAVLNEELEKTLKIIQKKSLLMFISEKNSIIEDTNNVDNLIRKVDEAITFLESFMPKKGFFYYKEIQETVFEEENKQIQDFLNVVLEKKDLQEALLIKKESLNEEIVLNLPFKSLPLKINALKNRKYLNFYFGFIHESMKENFEEFLTSKGVIYEVYQKCEKGFPIALALLKEDDLLINDINEFDFKHFTLPNSDEVMASYLEVLESELISTNEALNNNKETIIGYAHEIDLLYVYADQLRTLKARLLTPFIKTQETTVLSAWIRTDKIEMLEELLVKKLNYHHVEYLDPAPNEQVPTALKNNRFVENFETITDSYNIPNHKEIDPNPLMSFWYFLIFGIMMGDVGYGILMVVIFGLFLKFKKPKGGFKQLVTVFFYSGFMTIIAGILFGSFFGVDFDIGAIIGKLFNKNWSTVVISPMDEPLPMLIVSMAIGIIHIISGLVMKIILSIKLKEPFAALSEGVSWILILIGVVFLALSLVTGVPLLIGIILMVLGALLILLFSGSKEKSIFKKIVSGLGGLYGVTSYLSDVLSYSRILALSLSSAVIAFTFNLLAGMLQKGFIGFVISFVVYLVGHLFNFAMGLLSAYIHDSRLQYIEFYNKFYLGEGVKFNPLTREFKYIDELVMEE
ncbi:MAG: V-type ATP synthase subunit I [Acholeplasmatales bacterium]|jgi:V/A-type H+-transporting ATPase subunit I|nr:V-type ATP synthase subunit I [Acholeplasmataceae bacterium]MDY0114898.1 V-type ATP synthase subunit I [Acholeplasmatales bacterium]MCK9234220.1 V-type ATP synthase subunit I [Acholeplasmataceae bacterium]MCK9289257.1 V-type ATP synthase subunit I [Acholeplasmataceae bacterium]MCK9427161.1 V-type ATP synthase subunit I [Acholeplasmataceae bacterium]